MAYVLCYLVTDLIGWCFADQGVTESYVMLVSCWVRYYGLVFPSCHPDLSFVRHVRCGV